MNNLRWPEILAGIACIASVLLALIMRRMTKGGPRPPS